MYHIINFLWLSTNSDEKLQLPEKYLLLDMTYLINKS